MLMNFHPAILLWIFIKYFPHTHTHEMRIGIIYENSKQYTLYDAFAHEAINSINQFDDSISLPFQLAYTATILEESPAKNFRKVCQLLDTGGVFALVSLAKGPMSHHIASIGQRLDIPIVTISPNVELESDQLNVITLRPNLQHFSRAYISLIREWRWNSVLILYQKLSTLIKMEEIVREPPSERSKVRLIYVNSTNKVSVLRSIKSSEWKNIIIDGNLRFTLMILKMASQLEMMNHDYHYFVTTLDTKLTNALQDYTYNGVDLNAFVLSQDPYYQDLNARLFLNDLQKLSETSNLAGSIPAQSEDNSNRQSRPQNIISSLAYSRNTDVYMECALMFDSIYVIALGLQSLLRNDGMWMTKLLSSKASCPTSMSLEYGTTLINYINSINFKGMTGMVQLKQGKRDYISFDLIRFNDSAQTKIGSWDTSKGLQTYTAHHTDLIPVFPTNKSMILTSMLRPLIVTTILEKPYVIHSKCHFDNSCKTENDHFDGFCIELLRAISRKLGFKYEINVVNDGTYGAPDSNGEWTGMVKELIDNRADLAVAPLTINWQREQVIDFTKPFMSLGISILFKLPEKSKPGLFSFLNPLSFEIWLYVIAAFFSVSIVLFLLARFSPYEWITSHPSCCVANYLYKSSASTSNVNMATKSAQGSRNKDLTNSQSGNILPAGEPVTFWEQSSIRCLSTTKSLDQCNTDPPVSTLLKHPVLRSQGLVALTLACPGRQIDDKKLCSYGYEFRHTTHTFKSLAPYLLYHQPFLLYAVYILFPNGTIESVSTWPLQSDYFQPPVIENRFSFINCLWFALGTLMQQGSDISPTATSTRLVGGFWWFFTLILISSYTANLAAFLTVEKMVNPIESAEDLADQTKIQYGTLMHGSTYSFFKNAKVHLFQKMWKFMEGRPDEVFTQTQEEGIQRVLDGNYAFFMESTTIDYIIQRNCNLTQIGGQLDSKGYGIGTHLGSPFRDPISLTILELQESGQIALMYNKWWKSIGVTCYRDVPQESKASELGLENVGGIFVVLLAGILFAIIIGFIEFLWKTKKNPEIRLQPLWRTLGQELKFAVKCRASRLRPRIKRYCPHCERDCTLEFSTSAKLFPTMLRDDSYIKGLIGTETDYYLSSTYPPYHFDSILDPSTNQLNSNLNINSSKLYNRNNSSTNNYYN